MAAFAGRQRVTSFEANVENAMTAVLERLVYHEVKTPQGVQYARPHEPAVQYVHRTLQPFLDQMRKYRWPIVPDDLLDYVHKYYRGSRELRYNRAVETLLHRPVRAKDAYLAAFAKHEKGLLVDGKRGVPRLIQPRRPEYNVAVGRFLRPLEHRIYEDIALACGAPTVMKGFNAFEVARIMREHWESFAQPVAIGLDASRFDQHVSASVLKWEHSVYESYFAPPHRRELHRLLKMQLHNRGFVRCYDGEVSYTVDGTRCSGDMNTALGNCLIACSGVKTYADSLGIRVRLVDNGDDVVVFLEAGDVTRFLGGVNDYFAKLGFVMKVEAPVSVFERVSFCQTQPVYDGTRWRMVRDPRTSCTKDATLLGLPKSQVELDLRCDAIGKCGLALTGGLPVLQTYYTRMTTFTRPYVDHAPKGNAVRGSDLRKARMSERISESLEYTGFRMLARGLEAFVAPVSDQARYSFALAFDITPAAQRAIEDILSSRAAPVLLVRDGAPDALPI